MDEWIKKMWCVYSVECYSVMRKGGHSAICNSINEPWAYYAKWDKSGRERQILLYGITYMWNQKKAKLIKKQTVKG